MALSVEEVKKRLPDSIFGTIFYKDFTIEISLPEFDVIDDPLEVEIENGYVEAILSHRKYNFPSSMNVDFSKYSSWEELFHDIDKDIVGYDVVYLYDHSGLSLSYGDFSVVWDWDSGILGIIFYTKENIRNLLGCKYVTKKSIEKYKKFYNSLLEVYSEYVSGNTFLVEDPINLGYIVAYGLDDLYIIISDITYEIDVYIEKRRKEFYRRLKHVKTNVLKSLIKNKVAFEERERVINSIIVNLKKKIAPDVSFDYLT